MIGTMALVPQMVDAVGLPVIASGGIMDGRGVAAALALAADAVQLGTAFLACPEAGTPPPYRRALLDSGEDSTRITAAFSGRPARGIENRFLADMAGAEILPFPYQNALTRPLRMRTAELDRADLLSLWAGQGLRLARQLPAAELVRALVTESEAALARIQDIGPKA